MGQKKCLFSNKTGHIARNCFSKGGRNSVSIKTEKGKNFKDENLGKETQDLMKENLILYVAILLYKIKNVQTVIYCLEKKAEGIVKSLVKGADSIREIR